MARGWESKSVEAQQDEAAERSSPKKPRLTLEQAVQRRKVDGLQLSLQSALQQLGRTSDQRRRNMLEQAIADLRRELRELTP